MQKNLSFKAKIRLRNNGKSPASRHFITVEERIAKKIKELTKDQPRKGRGSVKVKVRIGFFDRTTSIFPDKKTGTYVLPIKKEARTELKIGEGDEVLVTLELL